MLSKANIKWIKSLQVKKYRKQEQCFTVEGAKSVQELLRSDFDLVSLFATEEFLNELPARQAQGAVVVRQGDLDGLGEFRTNNAALAVARMKPNEPFEITARDFALVLDDIHDPGNLGTIIRTADWYGIKNIVASPDCADFYSPKVIHSTMGSFTRVHVFYTEIASFLSNVQSRIFGAFLDGADVHQVGFGAGGMIVVGSESHGISPAVASLVTDRITIPRYGNAESLNAAVATAVICDNVRRRDNTGR